MSRTKWGKKYSRCKQSFSETWLAAQIINWYTGLYSGSIMLAIGIVNLMTIPYLHFYESKADWGGIKLIVT